MGIWKFLKGFRIKKIKGGCQIVWTTGPSFNPEDQKRTTPIEDFLKKNLLEDEEMLNKLSQPNKESE
jgi:hypothetical protein